MFAVDLAAEGQDTHFREYTLLHDEGVSEIAARCGVAVADLVSLNKEIYKGINAQARLKMHSRLLLPHDAVHPDDDGDMPGPCSCPVQHEEFVICDGCEQSSWFCCNNFTAAPSSEYWYVSCNSCLPSTLGMLHRSICFVFLFISLDLLFPVSEQKHGQQTLHSHSH